MYKYIRQQRKATPSLCAGRQGVKGFSIIPITSVSDITSSSSSAPSASFTGYSYYGYGRNDPPESSFGRIVMIVTRLGQVASSIAWRFCCGTTLSSPDQVNFVLREKCQELVEHNVPWCRASGCKAAVGSLLFCQFCRWWRGSER